MDEYSYQEIIESAGTCIKSSLDESVYTNNTYNISKNIKLEEYNKQYVNFKFVYNPIGFGSLLLEDNNGKYVSKNTNITVPVDIVKKDISFIFGLKDWQFKVIEQCNKVKCAFLIPNVDDNAKLLIKSMEQLGWFNSIISRFYIGDKEYVNMKFEPLYEFDITSEIYKLDCIYHVSPIINYKKIKKDGFIPLHNNSIFNYPDRVYFMKGTVDRDLLISVAHELYKHTKNLKTTKYNIYTISPNKINTYVRFQNDPNMEDGIFTYNKVPYSSVINVETIDLKEEVFL